MAIGDFIGSPLEFLDLKYDESNTEPNIDNQQEDIKNMYIDKYEHINKYVVITDTSLSYPNGTKTDINDKGQRVNDFHLKNGQWTDDTSMGLCMADSLILKQEFDGRDIRIRFLIGGTMVTQFVPDSIAKDQHSVGLGGNILSL